MTIKSVIAGLQKEKQEAVASRFPCRAIMVKNVAQYCELLSELKKISDIRVVQTSELFSNADVMPKYENLKASSYQNEWIILTGVSEYLRLFSKKEAVDRRFKSLWSFQAPASSTGRIIIPLWGCEAQWFDRTLNLTGDIRQQDFYYDCTDPNAEEQNLSLLVLSGMFEQHVGKLDAMQGDLKIGLQEWFDYWVDPSPEGKEFVLLTKRCNNISTVNGSVSIHVVKDTLTFLQEHMSGANVLLSQNCTQEMQNELFGYALKGVNLDDALLSILNVAVFNGIDVMGKWSSMSMSHKMFVALWFSLHPDDSYTCHCFTLAENVDDVTTRILIEIFNTFSHKPQWLEEFQQLKAMLALQPNERFFAELDQLATFESRLDFLSGDNRSERIYLLRMVGKWIRIDYSQVATSPKLQSTYPELFHYLCDNPYKPDEELSRYFTRYKAHKLENTVPVDESTYFGNLEVDAYDYRYSILSDSIDEDTVVLWIDAMGAEWLSLLNWTLEQNCDASIQKMCIVQANQPTETCYNDLWAKMDVPYQKLDKLDKLAHKGVVDDPDYYACIEEQLGFVMSIHSTASDLLKKYHRVIITGDHGTSRLAARCFHSKDGMEAPKDATICSHGRYCKLAPGTISAMPNIKNTKLADGSQYAVFTNYDHFKRSGFAAGSDDNDPIYGEVHGGGSPEEALVPIIVLDSKTEKFVVGEWDKASVKIAAKKAKLKLKFIKAVSSLQVKVDGNVATTAPIDDGKMWSVVFSGAKAGTFTPQVYADNKIVQVENITLLPALGGNDDWL